MKKNQGGFSVVEGLLILVIVGILGGTGWYVWNAKSNADKSLTAANHESNGQSEKSISRYTPKPNYTVIKDTTFNYSFAYPTNWTKTSDNPGSSHEFNSPDYAQMCVSHCQASPFIDALVKGSDLNVKASVQDIQAIGLDSLISTKTINVNGLKATQKTYKYKVTSDAPAQYVVDTRFKSSKNNYVIEFYAADDNGSPSNTDVLQEVLNSFRL